MKINLTYGSSYDIVITTKTGDVFHHEIHNAPLQDAVDFVESIFADETALRNGLVADALICDANTGEILAECTPDPDYEDEDHYTGDCDDFDLEMGFDPYEGCWTGDC